MNAADSERRTSFGSAAAEYQRGRPGYPAAALDWCLPEPAGPVVDVAAGTGKLTAGLLARRRPPRVLAVEPLAQMRALIPAPAWVVGGRAEQLPIRAGAVDAVVVGQAFHWFDREAALAECVRVLRPGGTLGLLWNVIDDAEPWVAAMADALAAEDRVSRGFDRGPPFHDVPGLSDPELRLVAHRQALDRDGLLANAASRSQIILLPAAERAAALQRVRASAPVARFELPLVCEAWRSVRLP